MINEIENNEDIAAKTPKTAFWKKAITTALIITAVGMYTPTTVKAGDYTVGVQNGQTVIIQTPQGDIGSLNGKQVIHHGGVGITNNGGTVARQTDQQTYDGAQPQTSKPVKYVPKYNYSTAKQYIDAAERTYQNKNYKKLIALSEEALYRIDQGKIKATQKEIEFIDHAKKVGQECYENSKLPR